MGLSSDVSRKSMAGAKLDHGDAREPRVSGGGLVARRAD